MRLVLFAVLCIPMVSHATSMTTDVIKVVNARCATPAWLTANAPLEVTRRRGTMSCAPGGKCSTSAGAVVDASDLTVTVQGCAAPLKGRFKATKRTCEGAPVFRFTGRLPKGQRVRVNGQRMGVSLRVAGNARLRCKRREPDAIERTKSRVHRLSVPRSAFSMQGDRVILAPSAFGAKLRDEPLYGQWSLDALKAAKGARKVRLEMLVTVSQSRMPADMGCWIREETSITARLKGTDLVMSGVNSRSRSEGIQPPPTRCPPLPRKW